MTIETVVGVIIGSSAVIVFVLARICAQLSRIADDLDAWRMDKARADYAERYPQVVNR